MLTTARKLLGITLAACLWVSCGGNSITFPQGPISGAGDLGFATVQINIQPFSSFDLGATFDDPTQVFTFTWNAPSQGCERYRLVFVNSPPFPLNPITQVTQVRLVGETTGLEIIGDTELTSFVQQSSSPLSALVVCIEDEEQGAALPRSNFESVSDLL